MYYHNKTAGKYFLVPVYMKAYYFNRGATEPMALMPRGLRMIRGNPYRTFCIARSSLLLNLFFKEGKLRQPL